MLAKSGMKPRTCNTMVYGDGGTPVSSTGGPGWDFPELKCKPRYFKK